MKLARRQLLQSIIAGFIGSQITIDQYADQVAWAADKYAQNLGQKTRRKLALLVGINQYDAKNEWLPLRGCVNDVELQKELLIHRFGFNPKDILILSDRQATRANIIDGIRSHLISQALLGDVVIVHFSGHGSQVQAQPSLVPVDGSFAAANETVNDITIPSLLLLLRAIAADKITCILDAGYSSLGNPILGNFRIRARPTRKEWQLSPEELALQDEFADKFPDIPSPTKPIKPIVLLKAATNEQVCVDANWNGFSSGLFTYTLTQQLWQMTSGTSLYTVLGNVVNTSDHLALPVKELNSAEKEVQAKQLKILSNYDLGDLFSKRNDQSADAFIQTVSSDRHTGEAWLGGIPLTSLENYGIGSVFSIIDDSNANVTSLVKVKSHNGLTAKVEAMTLGQVLQPDMLLQETIRVLPHNFKLVVALDAELSKIERIDATSALSALPFVIGVNATEQYADCLFGYQASSYGLFSVGRSPILGSFGAVGESVGTAIRRLQPQLESFLAAKLIHATTNQNSSLLNLKVSLEATSSNRIKMVAYQSTNLRTTESQESAFFNKCLTVGDRLSCRLENLTDELVHIVIFTFDARGKVMTPSFVTSPYANDSNIPPHQTLIIPEPITPFEWTVSAPQGLVDVQIIASRSPLSQTLSLLDRFSRQSPTGLVNVSDPLSVAKALLSDLHNQDSNYETSTEDAWVLGVGNWATIGFSYRVA
ncbi:Caspase domain-containing protein [Synechococcus sp. PCC 7502]|uniref:caspase family protein n=1 Tax=Synechococcus sp. PCC 7502 TaxID=1173263 RepID=UPI00029FE15D|nr:caspase family protein [Synechococcus sp. PCC 7502]AFY73056.1 Caspase domain-containing protein [Synechococcus sp. PCC 7502]